MLIFGYHWISIILWVLFLLVTVAFFTLGERKLMGAIQRRKGPDVVGFWGILQPAADGMKLVFKELILPLKSTVILFILGPISVFTISLTGWAVIPLSSFSYITSIHLAILYTLITGGLNIYGIILAGWSSNSRYAFLGGVRATAQMISYELVLGTINLFVAFYAGSYSYIDIVYAQQKMWFVFPLFPVFVMYLIVMLAETNRTPFDLAEAEAELVAGYNVEYSSIMFAMFFLGEYSNMILLSVICVLYFFGGWLGCVLFPVLTLILKVLFFCIFFVWVRATLPRYRYDQLMEYGWKHLLPFSFGLFIFLVGITLVFGLRSDIDDLISSQNLLYYIYNNQQGTLLTHDVNALFFQNEVFLMVQQNYDFTEEQFSQVKNPDLILTHDLNALFFQNEVFLRVQQTYDLTEEQLNQLKTTESFSLNDLNVLFFQHEVCLMVQQTYNLTEEQLNQLKTSDSFSLNSFELLKLTYTTLKECMSMPADFFLVFDNLFLLVEKKSFYQDLNNQLNTLSLLTDQDINRILKAEIALELRTDIDVQQEFFLQYLKEIQNDFFFNYFYEIICNTNHAPETIDLTFLTLQFFEQQCLTSIFQILVMHGFTLETLAAVFPQPWKFSMDGISIKELVFDCYSMQFPPESEGFHLLFNGEFFFFSPASSQELSLVVFEQELQEARALDNTQNNITLHNYDFGILSEQQFLQIASITILTEFVLRVMEADLGTTFWLDNFVQATPKELPFVLTQQQIHAEVLNVFLTEHPFLFDPIYFFLNSYDCVALENDPQSPIFLHYPLSVEELLVFDKKVRDFVAYGCFEVYFMYPDLKSYDTLKLEVLQHVRNNNLTFEDLKHFDFFKFFNV